MLPNWSVAAASSVICTHWLRWIFSVSWSEFGRCAQGRRSGYESGGDGIHDNPERSFGGTNGEPPSEASQLRKGGPGGPPRKISKTYMANGAVYVIPELYL